MAKGPKYRVPFRRRREGKTNYHRRLKLIRSRRNRLVIRCTLKHTTVQIIESKLKGDKILVNAHTTQLGKEFGWKHNSSNLPSSYLCGYLCGIRAKKAGIDDAILDLGILVHDERVKAAFKGFLDAGIDLKHNESWFSETLEQRVQGHHIAEYATILSKEDKKLYKKHFSKVLKNKGDPAKIVDDFTKLKGDISKKV